MPHENPWFKKTPVKEKILAFTLARTMTMGSFASYDNGMDILRGTKAPQTTA